MAFSGRNETNPLLISVTGYAPYVAARAERACSKLKQRTAADRQVIAVKDYWRRKNFLDEITDYKAKHEKNLIRNQWECSSDKKSLRSRVQWEMDKVTAQMDKDLERRKNKLSELLRSEDQMYLKEINLAGKEDSETRQQRMLDRYTEIKMQKEMERQKIAREKREQQFRQNCDEFRSLMSRKLQRETAEEGKMILLEKEEETRHSNTEEELYGGMWRKDCEVKKQREDQEEQKRREKDAFYSQLVVEQIKEKELENIKKLRDKEEQAEIMAEEKRLLDLEIECEKENKRRKQMDMKTDLDSCLRLKLKQKVREVQNDLKEDLFFLKLLTEEEEEKKRDENKKALMKEQQEYFKYLENQMNKEIEFEKEIDQLYQEELEKMWEKRQKEWDNEKTKRRQLEQDVMIGIEEQILANIEKSKQVHFMNHSYAMKVLKEDEEDKMKAIEKLNLIREKNAKYQKELLDQIRMKEERVKEEKRQKEMELDNIRRAREAEESKIQQLLSEMSLDKEHPYRISRRELFNNCKGSNGNCH